MNLYVLFTLHSVCCLLYKVLDIEIAQYIYVTISFEEVGYLKYSIFFNFFKSFFNKRRKKILNFCPINICSQESRGGFSIAKPQSYLLYETKAYNFSCTSTLITETQCLHEKKVIKQKEKLTGTRFACKMHNNFPAMCI